MKKLLIIFAITICFTIQGFSQTTDVFPDTNAVWYIEESTCCPVNIESQYNIVSKRDTIINGKLYEIIGMQGTKLRDYAVREDTSKRVWIIYLNRLIQYGAPNDSDYSYIQNAWIYKLGNDSSEYLLYDFNVQNGDTISIYIPPLSESGKYINFPAEGGFVRFRIIGGQPQVCVNNVLRNQYIIDCIDTIPGLNNEWDIIIGPCIEGIGAECGGPVCTETFCSFEHNISLINAQENEHQIFPCISGINNFNNNKNISIFPNPANGTITINSNEIIKSYELINNLGQIILTGDNINSKSTNISSDKLISGIYFIKIYCNNNQVFINKLFINR